MLVSVRDRGPGIAAGDQRLIFEKFGRVDRAATSKPGTGLGLYIARSIAEAHGGTLEPVVRARPRRDVHAHAAGLSLLRLWRAFGRSSLRELARPQRNLRAQLGGSSTIASPR